MIASSDFNITRVEKSRLQSISLEEIPFGKYFTDHMLEVDYEGGEWKTVQIKPYQALFLSPSLSSLHYGQSIFEGIKAYKDQKGHLQIFRPFDNLKRFNISAERMEMPSITEEIFIEGMKELIRLDAGWMPNKPDHSIYIRPFMFATDEMIGVKPSGKYKFMIILSPTGPYYSSPMRIYVEEKYARAVKGGAGYAKNAGNYGAAIYPTAEAKRKGYDQVLWMDALEHKYVQECGTMNIFFVIGNKAITPDLDSGTILAGITRDSAIQLIKEMGLEVEERELNIDEIVSAYKDKSLSEVFGTGTAATISLVKELRYKDFVMSFDVSQWKIAPGIKERLSAIKEGKQDDIYNWMVQI
jgi:branched-chain amino acid aminotransferase